MFCTSCGEPLQTESKFCGACGKQVSTPHDSRNANSTPLAPPESDKQEARRVSGTETAEKRASVDASPKSARKTVIISLATVGILILLGVGVFAAVSFSNSAKSGISTAQGAASSAPTDNQQIFCERLDSDPLAVEDLDVYSLIVENSDEARAKAVGAFNAVDTSQETVSDFFRSHASDETYSPEFYAHLETLDTSLTEAKNFDFNQGGGGPAVFEIYKGKLIAIQGTISSLRELCSG